jgi:hypothetical protein
MQLVVIPEDHADLDVVPICISDTDSKGRRVSHAWLQAVPPVADPLRRLARTVLGDVWRVSELAQESVHQLSARHGDKLGPAPSRAIYVDASFRASDMAAGGRRARVGLDVELKDHVLASLREPHCFATAFEDKEFFQRLEQRLKILGLKDIQTLLNLYLSESEDQIPTVFAVKANSAGRNTLSQRFYRGLRKAIKLV